MWEDPYLYNCTNATHKDFCLYCLWWGNRRFHIHHPTSRTTAEVRGRRAPSFPPSSCQHVSVVSWKHWNGLSFPVGKQYCQGGNHSHSVLCLWIRGEEAAPEHVVLPSRAARHGRRGCNPAHVCCLHALSLSSIHLETSLWWRICFCSS